MDSEKKRVPWMSTRVEPPDALAPLQEWLDYRAELDRIEARFRIMFPASDWLPALREYRAEANRMIVRLTGAGGL